MPPSSFPSTSRVPDTPPWTTHPDELALLLACARSDARDHEALTFKGPLLAQALDCDRMLALGLLLAVRRLDAPVPAPVQNRLFAADATVGQLAHRVKARWLFTRAGFDRTPRWDQLLFFLQARRQWAHREPLLRECARLAVTPTANDRAFCPLPSRLSTLYYAVRPVRLLADTVRGRSTSAKAVG